MKILITLNYQREIPPFMLTELTYAEKSYDKVIYITRELVNDNRSQLGENNIQIIQISKRDRVSSAVKLPVLFAQKAVISELRNGIRFKELPQHYIKYLLLELYRTENIYHVAESVIKKYYKKAKITLQAVWFNECAIAIAKIKKKYPDIMAISFAHSYEIDPLRTVYVGYSLDQYKLDNLDKIDFIAKRMEKIYRKALPKWITYDENKLGIRYLGCIKLFDSKRRDAKDDFVLCTCSGCEAVKRIDLLINALSEWEAGPITWIHIGGGPYLEEWKKLAHQKLDQNRFINYRFEGKLVNRDVQRYYSEHYISLFVNVSKSEGLPVSIMEAMSYGIPALATDVGGTAEIVTKDTGMLLNVDFSGSELRAGIEYFFKMPEDLLEQYRERAFDMWKNNFDAVSNIHKYYLQLEQDG